jgi:hypothetical protein
MDGVLHNIIKGNKGKVFSDDGKNRIFIVSSLNFTQDVLRIKPGSKAPGTKIFDGVLPSRE